MDMPLPQPEVAAVVVEAARLPPLAGEAVFSARQIDFADLVRSPRLDAALKTVPGVSLFRRTGSDGGQSDHPGISLRSIAPSGAGRALVTLNGTPVNDPFGGWVIWSALPSEGLSGATIVRGAGAGAYGAGALTGVIALEERRLGQDQDFLSAGLGSFGWKRLTGIGGGEGLTLVGAIESGEGYRPVRGPSAGQVDTPTKFNSANISGQINGDLGGARAAIRLGGYEERRGAGLLGANSEAKGLDLSLTLAEVDEKSGWRLQAWARRSDLSNSSVAVGSGRALVTPAADQYSTPALGYGFNAALQGRGRSGPGRRGWTHGSPPAGLSSDSGSRTAPLHGVARAAAKQRSGDSYLDITRSSGPLIITGGFRLDEWRQNGGVRIERDLATGALTLDNPARDNSGTTATGRLGVQMDLSRRRLAQSRHLCWFSSTDTQ